MTKLLFSVFQICIIFFFHISLCSQNRNLDSLLAEHNIKLTNEKVIVLIGEEYAAQKKWDLAIKFYKKLVELDPENSDYFYRLGGTQAAYSETISKFKVLSLIKKAKLNLIKANKLDKSNIFSRWALVQILTELPAIIGGDKEKAKMYTDEIFNISKIHGLLAKQYIYSFVDNNDKLQNIEDDIVDLLEKEPNLFDFNYFNYKAGILLVDKKYKNYNLANNYLSYYINKFSSADRFSIENAYYLLAYSNFKLGDNSYLYFLDKSDYLAKKSLSKDYDLIKKIDELYKVIKE